MYLEGFATIQIACIDAGKKLRHFRVEQIMGMKWKGTDVIGLFCWCVEREER